jgi:hypothetical protein
MCDTQGNDQVVWPARSSHAPSNQASNGMRVIIAGSRDITDYQALCDAVQQSDFPVGRVLTGMARGVDTLAIRYATEKCLPLDQFPAQWNKWGRSAGYRRNEQMAQNADALIAIWDGRSPGTRHMIDVAKARGLRIFVVS